MSMSVLHLSHSAGNPIPVTVELNEKQLIGLLIATNLV